MNDEIRFELKKLRHRINKIPFTNGLKKTYTLSYVKIINEIPNSNSLAILDRISILNQLMDVNY